MSLRGLSSTQSSPEPSFAGVSRQPELPNRKFRIPSRERPLLWWKREGHREDHRTVADKESGKRTLVQPGGLGFHFGQ